MPEEIQDISTINKLIDNLFSVLPFYLLIDNKPVHVKIITNTDKGLIIKIPTEINPAMTGSTRILTGTSSGSLYIFLFKVIGSQNGYEILKPDKVSVKTASREYDRVSVDTESYLFKLFVTNIANQSKINESLSSNSVKVSNIIKSNLPKLKAKYSDANIYIQERPDTRLRLLNNYDAPIFIPDFSTPNLDTSDLYVPFNEYKELIKPPKMVDKIRSEIAIPLKYRNYAYIGYILVNHSDVLKEEDLKYVQQVAFSFQREIYLAELILESKEICYIHDLSKKGLSFFHVPTKTYNKIFESGGTILLDLVLSETEKNTLRAIVRNIKPMEKEYRIGCEFHPQSADELHCLEEFLNKQAVQSMEKNKKAKNEVDNPPVETEPS